MAEPALKVQGEIGYSNETQRSKNHPQGVPSMLMNILIFIAAVWILEMAFSRTMQGLVTALLFVGFLIAVFLVLRDHPII
jgi:hypothetical protein